MARNPWYEAKPRARKPARGAARAAHRVRRYEPLLVLGPGGGYAEDIVVELQHCRCGAWRAVIEHAGRAIVSDWSDPCSRPSQAKARDEAVRES